MNSTTLQSLNFDKKILNELTLSKLKILATELNLKIPSGTNKEDSIKLIQKHGRKLQKNLAKTNSIETTINEPKSKESKPTESKSKESKPKEPKPKETKPKEPKPKETKPKIKKSPTRSRNEPAGKTQIGKYKIIKQLGVEGKEGTCYLVENRKGEQYAMKCFAKSKSPTTLQKEALAQKEVAKYDLAPKIKEVNEDEKFIVMDYLDKNLFDIVKKNDGNIPDIYQKKIGNLITKLDETGVFHGDPNPANFMLKGQKMYIIDFGFAKDIDDRLIKKYDTETPNKKFMPIGLILKLKEIYRNHNPNIEYKVLSQFC